MTERSKMRFLLYLQALFVFLIIGCDNNEEFDDKTNTGKIHLNEYLPLKIGNKWEYKVSVSGNGIFMGLPEVDEIELIGVDEIANEEPGLVVNNAAVPDVTRATFFISPPHHFAISGNRILYHIDPSPWGKLGFMVYIEPEMILGEEIVTVPAGTFTCIKILRDNSCNCNVLSVQVFHSPTDLLPVYEWYCKGVGMVKREDALEYRKEIFRKEGVSIDYINEPEFRYVLAKYEIK